ncbi:MAG TPA: glycine cleavage system protein GcvH [Planctomycetaceae bacterium]|nr:glycine cleavage system protein GcvH [Planctomycetaceae bacterium]
MDKNTLRYTPSHEWVYVDGDAATVGITDHAVKALTDLVYIELPEVGRTLAANEAFGEVESVKAVSDLLSPVAGEIVEVNSEIADNLDVLTADPFARGWLIKLRLTAPVPTSLLDRAAYEKLEEGE